jgi:hypothetical protein
LTDIQDNLESANAKIGAALTNIDIAFKQYVPTHQSTVIDSGQQSHTNGQTNSAVNDYLSQLGY